MDTLDAPPTPFTLIRVDLNRDPDPSPDRHDQEHHPVVDELIVAPGGLLGCPSLKVIPGDASLVAHDHQQERDHHRYHEYCSVKWMSSKMRIMKKMTTGSATHQFELGTKPAILENESSSSNSNSNRSSISGGIESSIDNNNNYPMITRVCSDCNTTKTPLWRSGPRGPKSLCNACGIRQRKARRAMAMAAAAANGEPPPYPIPDPTQKAPKKKKRPPSSKDKDDEDEVSDPQPKKKRKRKGNKIAVRPPSDPREKCFEEFRLRLSERISGFQGMFPQDEKEAAILLMALSYGLVQS